MEAHRKFILFTALGIPRAWIIAWFQFPRFRSGTRSKKTSQKCRQDNEECLQFRVICEVTTAWPVQDINGNKDDGAYEKNLLD